ncbi:sulfotransferase domain-containing protein [Pseudalkalibacillus hwajinpoensis]|uniref:Sulfotransferase domain-containing protein n=1 Tax=Guptibacillus hwajinpoensis TaxID=208199 RepID=A0A4U1MMD2_9BACL|nr:sulfotransferase domain-containing protein [Pseudalkalibacillus hwajinpoensis]TKD71871.1 sulfotransferase domain-containing protein [Pseudalkalibacillus hwajinpoensis]
MHNQLPPFLMTSVPKSGTYLLYQILTGMPEISSDRTSFKRFFTNSLVPEDYLADHKNRLTLLSPNEFGLGHIRYSQEYVQLLQHLQMKHIFIHRDPRDVCISLSYYIKEKWKTHPLHNDFNITYQSDKERHLAIINGVSGKWPSFDKYFFLYYKWLLHEETHHVSYEELMINEESREKAIKKIIQFLWKDLTPPTSKSEMYSKILSNLNPSSSNTFRSGKIGGWRKEFDNEIKHAFKEEANHLLLTFGYESTSNW